MAKKRLTDRFLKALKPAQPGSRYDVWDDVASGLGARVNDRRQISFVLMKRFAGAKQPTRRKVGDYPAMSLEAARKTAVAWNGMTVEGHDPKVVAEKKRHEVLRRQQHRFEVVAEAFIAKHVSRLRTAHGIAQDIRREFVPLWGKRPITDITRADVLAAVEAIANRGTPSAARNQFAYLRKMFAWAVARGSYGLEHSPCSLLKPTDLFGKPALRQRILTEDEWRAFWKAASAQGYPFGPMYQMLALTGARLDEWASATWAEADLDRLLFTLAPQRDKSNSGHIIPLGGRAVAILQDLPRHKGPFVFSTTDGERPVSGFSRAKTRLDALMGVKDWRVHDIRRSCRTGLSALGVQDRVAELTIGHTVQGLRKVYDLHAFIDERRDALARWERHLLGVVEGRPANVIPLARA